MAKRRHSTALFEVITKPQAFQRATERRAPQPGFLTTAAEWIKRHVQSAPKTRAAVSPNGKAVDAESVENVAAMMLTAPTRKPAMSDPVESRSVAREHAFTPIARELPPACQPMDDYEDDELDDEFAHTVAVAVDPDQRQISVKMSYTAAVVGGMSLALVVGLAIIAAQRFSRGSSPLLAQTTTDKLREGPAHPEVLEPQRRVLTGSPNGQPQVARTNSSAPVPPKAPVESRSLSSMTTGDGKRYVNLNYVIIQSYHPAEEKMAQEAAAMLNKEGVACTVEKGVKGYQAITVVGLQGFDKISTVAYRSYTDHILQISKKLTSNNHSYKALTPVAKKWDRQE